MRGHLTASSCAVLLLATTTVSPVAAQAAAELEDVRIVSHHFVTALSGRSRSLSVRDPSTARYLLLKVVGTLPRGSGRIFTYDFTLRYQRNNRDDRTGCRAIGTTEGTEPGEYGRFLVGYGSSLTVSSGTVHFGLACFIEPNVSEVDIYRIGTAQPIHYTIGRARPYSVFITTNRQSDLVMQVAANVRDGGYYVKTSRGLNRDQTGITIHYREQAETQAREISQRIMTMTGLTPTVKTMSLSSEHDVVVWLGR